MNIPVTFEDIKEAYFDLDNAIDEVFRSQVIMNDLELQKADIWAELLDIPDFKPGKSNLEQTAKLRAASPNFMERYEQAERQLALDKNKVEHYRNRIASIEAILDLGKILVAVKEDLDT